jgi:hypothetical protein
MKTWQVLISATLMLFVTTAVLNATSNKSVDPVVEIQRTFADVFQALQAGDVAALKGHLSGAMYEQYKVLLEENSEYPAFLRNFYKGATFSVDNIAHQGDNALVDVIITFPSGSRTVTKMLLKQVDSNNWKLMRVVHDNRE